MLFILNLTVRNYNPYVYSLTNASKTEITAGENPTSLSNTLTTDPRVFALLTSKLTSIAYSLATLLLPYFAFCNTGNEIPA